MAKYRLVLYFEKNGWGHGVDCDCVTDENQEVWRRFMSKKVRELLTPKMMECAEYKAIEQEIAIEQQQWLSLCKHTVQTSQTRHLRVINTAFAHRKRTVYAPQTAALRRRDGQTAAAIASFAQRVP